MRYNTIGYIIAEGFRSVGKQKKMTSASIIIMCATMLMFGLFFVIGENINYVVKQFESQQGMKVIIKDGTSQDTIEKIGNEIRQIDGVNKVTFNSKEDALSTVKGWLGDNQYLLSGWDEENPFPASYFVTLTDLSKNKEAQSEILKLDGVQEINSKNDTIANLESAAKGIRAVTIVLLVLLVVISIFIISYTIKLTVHARRREISIMKYVGATNGFIRGPFIVEGIIIGIVSAILTLAVLGLTYNVVLGKVLESSLLKTMTISLLGFSDIFVLVLIVYLLLGIGIGILGSAISMKKYLEV